MCLLMWGATRKTSAMVTSTRLPLGIRGAVAGVDVSADVRRNEEDIRNGNLY